MPIRNLSEIYIPDSRVRKEFDPARIEELITSILSPKGLLHPPVVEVDGALLVGERRWRALVAIADRGLHHTCNGKSLRPGLIYTTDIKELSPADKLEAEIEENTVRVDITWQEKAQAIEALHRLRQLQKEETTLPGITAPTQTIAETAAEVKGKPLDEVRRWDADDIKNELIVAAWLSAHPEDKSVSSAKTRAEALRNIEKQLEDEHRGALARQFLRSRPTTGHILRQIDICTALPDTPDALYDVIITDPPWGAGAHQWQNGTSLRRHTYVDDLHTFERIHECLATEGYRVCKEKAHLYLFCAFQHFDALATRFRAAGWDVWPRPLIWWHGSQGIPPRPEFGPKNTYECILFANKGAKRVLSVKNDVIYALKRGDDERAASKPVAIYYDLLSRSVLPGDEILDPCCGTAPLIPAATALKVRATCYDISDEAIGIASQRLEEKYEHEETSLRTDKRGAKLGKATP